MGTPRRAAAAVFACLLAAGCATASAPLPTPDPTATRTPAPATPRPTRAPTPSPEPTATPSVLAADLSGVLVDPALAHRLPLAVAIDDNRVARPQSGFNATAIVWHAPADGYEVRYLLVFQELDASDIGPVRSARIYIAQWASELKAALGHYGGDRLSLKWIKGARGSALTDVDGIGAGNGAFHRISSREAPHNAYTNTADLWAMASALGGPAAIDPAVHVRPFRDDSPASDRGTSQSITVPYRTVTVGYTYDPASNAYLRSLDGKAHVDPMDKARVTARTVVVLEMSFRTDSTIEPGHNRPVLGFVGSGKATIFSEGLAVTGTWSKASETAPTILRGPDGEELELVRGRIFIQVVPTGTKVTVKG